MTRFIACHLRKPDRGQDEWRALCGRSSDNLTPHADSVTCRHCQRMLANKAPSNEA